MFFKSIYFLINFISILNYVAGQPGAFLPVLDTIPGTLLQDLPGQYGMAFNGAGFNGQFGQRFPPQHQLRQPELNNLNYQPLLQLNKPGQLTNHQQQQQNLHSAFKNRLRNNNNSPESTIFENQRHQTYNPNNENQNHLINDNLNENNFESGASEENQNDNQNDNQQQQKQNDKDDQIPGN